MPIRFSWNPSMTWPLVGKSEGREGKLISHVAEEVIGRPAAVPTLIRGAAGFTFIMGASGVRKKLLAPESTIAVFCLIWRREANLANVALYDLCGEGGLRLEGEINDFYLECYIGYL